MIFLSRDSVEDRQTVSHGYGLVKPKFFFFAAALADHGCAHGVGPFCGHERGRLRLMTVPALIRLFI
jgi:hypothetical protein